MILKIVLILTLCLSGYAFADTAKVDESFLLRKLKDDPTLATLIKSYENSTPRADLDKDDIVPELVVKCEQVRLTTEILDGLILTPRNIYWVGFLIKCSTTRKDLTGRKTSGYFCGQYRYSELTDSGYPNIITTDCNGSIN